jgi:hypothetical protein
VLEEGTVHLDEHIKTLTEGSDDASRDRVTLFKAKGDIKIDA